MRLKSVSLIVMFASGLNHTKVILNSFFGSRRWYFILKRRCSSMWHYFIRQKWIVRGMWSIRRHCKRTPTIANIQTIQKGCVSASGCFGLGAFQDRTHFFAYKSRNHTWNFLSKEFFRWGDFAFLHFPFHHNLELRAFQAVGSLSQGFKAFVRSNLGDHVQTSLSQRNLECWPNEWPDPCLTLLYGGQS